jgi:type IV pilus assembly protein PilA
VVCSKCGSTLADGSLFCKVCGSAVSTPGAPLTPPGPFTPQPTDGKAIASLILGFFFFFLPAAIVAVILGHLSLSEIRKSTGRLKGEGLAIGGLVLGYMGLAVIPILIIAAIAIPNLLRARIAANEDTAVNSIRTLNLAEVTYAETNHHAGYTCALSDLSSAGLLAPQLASGARSGYVLALENCSAETPGGPNVKYQVVAYPMTRNQTGVRAFCSDESGVIKLDVNGSPQTCLESGSALQ